MLSGAYSHRYQAAEKQHVEQLKQIHHDNQIASDQVARNRRLQQDTNRRRRALAVKRKLEAQREEKRRQEILSRRRNEIQEATERYQRQNRHFKALQEALDCNDNYQGQTWQRNVEHVLHHFGEEETWSGGNYSAARATPALEDALRLVRGSPQYRPGSGRESHGSRQGSAHTRPANGGPHTQPARQQPEQHNAMHRPYPPSYAASPVSQGGDLRGTEAAMRAQLQSNSLRNLTNSRSLFEQQLEQTQHQLKQQQRATLQQFNAAIWKQLEESGNHNENHPGLQRADSITSMDSLEEDNNQTHDAYVASDSNLLHNSQHGLVIGSHSDSDLLNSLRAGNSGVRTESGSENGAANATPMSKNSGNPVSAAYTSVASSFVSRPNPQHDMTSAGFILHRSNGSPSNVAIVQPQVVSRENIAQQPTSQFFEPKPPPTTCPEHLEKASYGNQELLLEDAQEVVMDAIDAPVPHKLAVKPNHMPHPPPATYQVSGQRQPVVNYVTTQGTMFSSKNATSFSSNPRDIYGGMNNAVPHHKAWATPSPAVPEAAVAKPPTTHVSHKSPYGSRATATNVTVATSYAPTSVASKQNHIPVSTVPTTESRFEGMYHQHQYSTPSKASSALKIHAHEEESDPEGFKTDDSLEDEEQEEETKVKPERVRGILKKPHTPTDANPAQMRKLGLGIRASFMSNSTGKIGAISTSNSAAIRDSIEVTRSHIDSRNEDQDKVPRKKSVRFADLTYADDASEGQTGAAPSNMEVTAEEEPVKPKPPRPTSAKITSATPKSNAATTHGRISSAGSYRGRARYNSSTGRAGGKAVSNGVTGASPSGDAGMQNASSAVQNKPSSGVKGENVPGTNHQVVAKPPSGSGTPASSSRIPVSNKPTAVDPATNKQAQHAQAAAKARVGEPVFDANGVRLDRTPTDEEINWLWEKVRTCLSRNSTVGSSQTEQNTERTNSASRQTAPMSQKFIDGNSLAPQCRTTPRVTSNYVPPNVAKKLSMNNLNNYTRRMGNGNTQQPQGVNTPTPGVGQPTASNAAYVANGYHSAYTANANERGPYPMATNGNYPYDTNGTVSESMAAFLVAEKLSHKSAATQSQIERAMEAVAHKHHDYNANRITPKTPSAVSIEEQRLMQSLERLNERLKMTETALQPSHAYLPRPPPQRPTHAPSSGHSRVPVRRYSANGTGTVSRHNFRTGSAGTIQGGSAGLIRPTYGATS